MVSKELHNWLPEVGLKYFWARSDKSIFIITVLELDGDTIHLGLESYLGNCMGFNPRGYSVPPPPKIEWTLTEWTKANLLEYYAPVTTSDLAENELVCDICHGKRFEMLQDLTLMRCFACAYSGKIKKKPPALPVPKARSSFHPAV